MFGRNQRQERNRELRERIVILTSLTIIADEEERVLREVIHCRNIGKSWTPFEGEDWDWSVDYSG